MRGDNVLNLSFGSVRSHQRDIYRGWKRSFKARVEASVAALFDRQSKQRQRCFACSEQVRRELEADYGTSSWAVPLGIDTRHFSPRPDPLQLRARHGLASDATVGAFVGRWAEHHKGLDLLVPVMQHRKDIHWVIAADRDPGLSEIEHLTVLGGLSYEELPAVYSMSDFTIQLSRYESFGFSFVESLACGTPVITPAVGVVPEIYADFQFQGLVVPRPGEKSEDDVTAAVHRAIDRVKNRVEAETLGRSARAVVERDYSLEAWKRRLAGALRAFLEGNE